MTEEKQSEQQLDPSELSLDQLIQCIHNTYKEFRTYELSYQRINNIINQRQPAPIEHSPTGEKDEDGKPLYIVKDYEALLRFLRVSDPDERKKLMSGWFGHWNNFYANLYASSLERLLRYVSQAVSRMKKE
jgi:hypothetical protein